MLREKGRERSAHRESEAATTKNPVTMARRMYPMPGTGVSFTPEYNRTHASSGLCDGAQTPAGAFLYELRAKWVGFSPSFLFCLGALCVGRDVMRPSHRIIRQDLAGITWLGRTVRGESATIRHCCLIEMFFLGNFSEF